VRRKHKSDGDEVATIKTEKKSQAKPLPIRENFCYLTRSIPLVAPEVSGPDGLRLEAYASESAAPLPIVANDSVGSAASFQNLKVRRILSKIPRGFDPSVSFMTAISTPDSAINPFKKSR